MKGKLKLLVKWYGYVYSENSWEPISGLPYSVFFRYFKRNALSRQKKLTVPNRDDAIYFETIQTKTSFKGIKKSNGHLIR